MFKKALVLLLVLLFLPVLTASGEKPSENMNMSSYDIRVLLRRLNLTDRIDLRTDGPYVLSSESFAVTLPAGTECTLQLHSGVFYFYEGGNRGYSGLRMRLSNAVSLTRADETAGLRVSGSDGLYPGDLSLTVSGGLIQGVLTLPIETYLLGVLPYEMSDSFPLEALKAQAVCARTYAFSHLDPSKGYDVVDTTNDQVYRGSGNHPNCARAVRETAGVIGTRDGQPVMCYYSASNGGQTELPGNVWAGVDLAKVYQMVDDPYDLANPESIVKRAYLSKSGDYSDAWTDILWGYAQKTLLRKGYDGDRTSFRIDSIDTLTLTGNTLPAPSRFVTELQLTLHYSGKHPVSQATATPGYADGSYDEDDDVLFFVTTPPLPTPVPGALGPWEKEEEALSITVPLFPDIVRALKLSIYGADNEMITLREEDTRYVLEARRYGHGVGMSQRGAQYMAGHEHWSFDQILAFYYPGMELRIAPSGVQMFPTVDPYLMSTPAPAATPTPRPTIIPLNTDALGEEDYLYIASVEGIDDDSSLNLRAEPSMAGEILMRLYKHQQLLVTEVCEDEAWVHVRAGDLEGYVMVSFLESIPKPTDTSSPTT
ncbi:MAG: SpoIID/LytB domain-containing protein [Clostridia bacterium]|nr:SpoIID/LytB domain-containing protein [Clostridia bacterium]